MRAALVRLGFLLSLLIASSASAVSMAWTPIGNPGNTPDSTGHGAVGYAYQIGTYDVTNAQYAEFLNAKASSDPLGLYSPYMDPSQISYGGISRSGTPGSYTYSVTAGRQNIPVNHVTFYDALRFANWLNNGQGNGDTEAGSYTLLGGTATPTNGTTVTRNAGATIVLPSENEWYKAAYYDSSSSSYFAYPTRSNNSPLCTTPSATPNTANCGNIYGDLTPVGSYTGSPSPYGTFDQGGNIYQWNEAFVGSGRAVRGGWLRSDVNELAASFRVYDNPSFDYAGVGFRLAMIPEPGTGLLVIAGLLGLAGWRRVSA